MIDFVIQLVVICFFTAVYMAFQKQKDVSVFIKPEYVVIAIRNIFNMFGFIAMNRLYPVMPIIIFLGVRQLNYILTILNIVFNLEYSTSLASQQTFQPDEVDEVHKCAKCELELFDEDPKVLIEIYCPEGHIVHKCCVNTELMLNE